MTYTKQTWADSPATTSPISAARLTHIEDGIGDAHDLAAGLETSKATTTALTTGLAGKADSSHTHTIGNVTGLQAALDGKAGSTHSHAVADVTGLQATLDGKAPASHTHAIGDTTGLQTALDGKAGTTHSHAVADVTGLQAALDGKQASGTYATTTSGVLTEAQRPLVGRAPVALTDGATVNTDASLGTQFELTAGGDRTLAAPTNPTNGQRGLWVIVASGATRTITLASGTGGFDPGSGSATEIVASGTTTLIGAIYSSTSQRWRVVARAGGFG
jgi:tail-like repeat protein